MTTAVQQSPARGLAALRRLVMPKPAASEACEMCAREIAEEHRHLVNSQDRRLLCVCDACSILFDHAGATVYRRVPLDIRELRDVNLSDALWHGLGIPAGLVFFMRSSAQSPVLAIYPSPAGPTETTVEEDVWQEISAAHPRIASLRTDVEALLVNRAKGARDYFIVPVDECYKLTAIVRQSWRGFSGGDEAWERIGAFFASLRQRAHA